MWCVLLLRLYAFIYSSRNKGCGVLGWCLVGFLYCCSHHHHLCLVMKKLLLSSSFFPLLMMLLCVGAVRATANTEQPAIIRSDGDDEDVQT